MIYNSMIYNYGNMGCGIFKRRTKLERFLRKNQHTQRKLLYFENRKIQMVFVVEN